MNFGSARCTSMQVSICKSFVGQLLSSVSRNSTVAIVLVAGRIDVLYVMMSDRRGGVLCLDLLLFSNMGNLLDDANGDGPLHVTNGKATQRWELGKCFHAKGLGWDYLDDCSVASLNLRGVLFNYISSSTVQFRDDLFESTGNMSSVAVQNWTVAGMNGTRVGHDNDLRNKGLGASSWFVMRVTSHIATLQVLHRNILDIESNVVARKGLRNVVVMHFDRLDVGSHTEVRRDETKHE